MTGIFFTCSIPVGPNVDDYASREVENIKAWAVKNLMKLNLSKTKEIVMKGRTTLPSPDEIVNIKRVSYLKLLGVTFQDSPTNWKLSILTTWSTELLSVCIYSECVKTMVIVFPTFITFSTLLLCHSLFTLSKFGVLLLIVSIWVKLIGYRKGHWDLGHTVCNIYQTDYQR